MNLLQPLKIGSLKFPNNLALAPMAGITDLPFRQLCREMGAGITVSEMVASDPSLRASKKTLRRIQHLNEPELVCVQIVGHDPRQMANAAAYNVAKGAALIDINMGCPAKKVCRKQAGAALLGNEDLVRTILQTVVKAVDVPVTLKIRTGISQDRRNGVQIAKIAQDAGIQAIAVHGRTRAARFSGEAEYLTIREICRVVDIPVLANGDIDSAQKAAHVLQLTGADGIMLGRAAQGRPWIFKEISHYLKHGQAAVPPSTREINSILTRHVKKLHLFYGDISGVRIARKHIGWYLRTRKNGAAASKEINTIDSVTGQLEAIESFLNQTHMTRVA